jgi:auxin-responsive protein IAA
MQQDLRNSDRRNPEQAYPVMSASSTNSAASPAVSGLDYDDTALTLALPGSSAEPAADRKRAHADHDKPPSPKSPSPSPFPSLYSSPRVDDNWTHDTTPTDRFC